MKSCLLLLLIGFSASLARSAEPLFGMEPGITGLEGLEEMEKAEIPGMLDRANVPGKLRYRSPDGRYAFSHPTLEQAEKSNYNVENHLVNLQNLKALTKESGGLGQDFENRNHGGLHVRWRSDSRAVLFMAEGKWEPDVFSAIVISESEKVRVVDLATPLRLLMVRHLKREWRDLQKKLNREPISEEDLALHDDEISPWAQEFIRYGAAFSPDGKRLKVQATLETNAKHMEGEIVAHARAEGEVSLEDGTLQNAQTSLTRAGIVTYLDDGNEVMKPDLSFPQK